MENNQLQATTILTLDTVELYQSIKGKVSLITKGPLNILYIQEYNCYFLNIKDFNYSLSKEIPILATPSKNSNGYPSYVLPMVEGFYVVKIIKISSIEDLSNLETILDDRCTFNYKVEEVREEAVEVKPKEEKKEMTKAEIAATVLEKGGDLTKKGIILAAQGAATGIRFIGGLIQSHYVKKTETTEVSEDAINKAKTVSKATGTVFVFTQKQMKVIVSTGKDIGAAVGKKLQTTETAKNFDKYEHRDTIVEVGRSSIYAFAAIFEGLSEAVDIIARGVGDATHKVVKQKYGDKAGEFTEHSLDAVGNVGKLVGVHKHEALIGLQDATRKEVQKKEK